MKNDNTYFVNPSAAQERVKGTVYKRRDAIAAKWQPFAQDDNDAAGFCGNYSSNVYFNAKTGKWALTPKGEDGERVWPHELPDSLSKCSVISSALLLYRLACVFKPIVSFDGPEGYKMVWAACFRHVKSGQEIMFYEWKGGITFGARAAKGKRKDGPYAYTPPTGKQFEADFLQLLNFLCSSECPHPYDGTVSGSVA